MTQKDMDMEDEKDEVFESLLRSAVIQSGLNRLEDYPPQKEIDKLVVPEACDRRIRKMIRRHGRQERLAKLLKSTRKAAAVLAILLGAGIFVLLQFDEVRASCYNAIMQFYEKHVQLDYRVIGKEKVESLQLNYVPEGYVEVEREIRESGFLLKYENENGNNLILYYSSDAEITVDDEHYDIYDVKVKDTQGKYFSSNSPERSNYLIWYDEHNCYTLISTLDMKEMKKIANNLNN